MLKLPGKLMVDAKMTSILPLNISDPPLAAVYVGALLNVPLLALGLKSVHVVPVPG